jgi:hypothetical protein
MRWNNLSGVLPVDFIAVILFGIMRCSNHYPAQCSLFVNTEWNEWCCGNFTEQINWDLLVDEDCCGQFGKSKIIVIRIYWIMDYCSGVSPSAVVSAIVAHYYASLLVLLIWKALLDVIRQSLASLHNHEIVHGRETSLHWPSKTGRAERHANQQSFAERVKVLPREQRLDFIERFPVLRIRLQAKGNVCHM